MGCVVFVEAHIPSGVLIGVVMSSPLYVGSSPHELCVPRSDGIVQLSASGCHPVDTNVIHYVRADVSYCNSLPKTWTLRVHSVNDNTLGNVHPISVGIAAGDTIRPWYELRAPSGCLHQSAVPRPMDAG